MSFSIMHLDGAEEVDPDPPAFAELLAELADAGDEQPDVLCGTRVSGACRRSRTVPSPGRTLLATTRLGT